MTGCSNLQLTNRKIENIDLCKMYEVGYGGISGEGLKGIYWVLVPRAIALPAKVIVYPPGYEDSSYHVFPVLLPLSMYWEFFGSDCRSRWARAGIV